MAFFIASDLPSIQLDAKSTRTLKARGGSLMASEVHFEAGGIGAPHEHPHEQIVYILDGELDFTLDKETRRVKSGDSLYVPPSVPHGCVALRPSRVLDIFYPQRDDFIS